MKDDLDRLVNPLDKLVKSQMDEQSGETRIYFDNLHLSPLKVTRKTSFVLSWKSEMFEKDPCELFHAWIRIK
jgi:hypothetical protein